MRTDNVFLWYFNLEKVLQEDPVILYGKFNDFV